MRIKKLSAVIGAVAFFTSLFVFASCGGKEKASGVAAGEKTEGQAPKIEANKPASDLAGTAEWPADMFEGVPKFTFGKIERVSKGDEGGMKKFNIYYRGMEKGGIEKYVELLKEAGWRADLNTAGGSSGFIAGEKGELGLNFMFNGPDGTGMLAVFSAVK
jgi:hypothetical protein